MSDFAEAKDRFVSDAELQGTNAFNAYMDKSLVWQSELELSEDEALFACRMILNEMQKGEAVNWESQAREFAEWAQAQNAPAAGADSVDAGDTTEKSEDAVKKLEQDGVGEKVFDFVKNNIISSMTPTFSRLFGSFSNIEMKLDPKESALLETIKGKCKEYEKANKNSDGPSSASDKKAGEVDLEEGKAIAKAFLQNLLQKASDGSTNLVNVLEISATGLGVAAAFKKGKFDFPLAIPTTTLKLDSNVDASISGSMNFSNDQFKIWYKGFDAKVQFQLKTDLTK